MISADDDIAVVGRAFNIRKLAENMAGRSKTACMCFADTLSRTSAGMAETIISPRSELIGKTMSEINFKKLYGLNPVLLFKENRLYHGGLTHIQLQMGDTLLLYGPWERFHIMRNQPPATGVGLHNTFGGGGSCGHRKRCLPFYGWQSL